MVTAGLVTPEMGKMGGGDVAELVIGNCMHLDVSIDKLLLVDMILDAFAPLVVVVVPVVVDVAGVEFEFMIFIVVELPFMELANEAIVGDVDVVVVVVVDCCCCCC